MCIRDRSRDLSYEGVPTSHLLLINLFTEFHHPYRFYMLHADITRFLLYILIWLIFRFPMPPFNKYANKKHGGAGGIILWALLTVFFLVWRGTYPLDIHFHNPHHSQLSFPETANLTRLDLDKPIKEHANQREILAVTCNTMSCLHKTVGVQQMIFIEHVCVSTVLVLYFKSYFSSTISFGKHSYINEVDFSSYSKEKLILVTLLIPVL